MRRAVLGVVLLVGLAAGVASAAWRTARQYLDDPVPLAAPVAVEVPAGATFRDVVARLGEAGVVTRPTVFDLYARARGERSRVKAGHYVFEPPVTPRQVLARLLEGAPRRQLRVTLPEGSNVWQVAARLDEAGVCGRQAFLDAAQGAEGRLFPDTYLLHPGTPAAEVVAQLRDRFDAVFRGLLAAHGPAVADLLGEHRLVEADLVTLASLVEEETALAEERPRIARVFYNRLARGIRLQTDPTCVYGEGTWREVPSPDRCRDPASRYSTYVVDGLPPGPISSPGRAALEAAMEPSRAPEDADLLFFVARRDGTGGHHFSRTLAEHTRAVSRYLKGGARR